MAKNLTNQLFSSLSLTGLAKNPLLITMIAATHRANLELPKRRVELYEEISKLLLGTRPFAKNTQLTLTASENKRILQVLAWQLMQAEIAQFTPEQGESWISDTLQRCCKERNLSATEFFTEMLETAGLLQEKELSVYEFTHQTFQEYFAALHLREMGEAGLNILLENLDNERLYEVICFYAALGNADPLISVILDNPGLKKLKLANRCKNEGREVSPEIVKRLNLALQEEVNAETSEVSLETHFANSPSLKAEVVLEERFANLTPIDEKAAISESITRGEYQLFLQDQASKQFHSTADLITIIPNSENQPVTGIKWEDARWFCGWLATQTSLQTEGKVYDYRLPTEAEINKAGGRRQSPLPPLKRGEAEGLIAWTDNPNSEGNVLRVVREEIPNRYQALLNYLANGRWREADSETVTVMLEVAGKPERGYLSYVGIQQFPCEDLRLIDRLWVKYSGGHFGFSVQKKIWLECGGKVDDETECKLGDRLGWRKDGEWKMSDIPYELLPTTPVGQLPGRWVVRERVVWGFWVSSLAQRTVTCSL